MPSIPSAENNTSREKHERVQKIPIATYSCIAGLGSSPSEILFS